MKVSEVWSWDNLTVYSYLSVLGALWDEVFDQLRGVTFELKDKHVFVKCYVDGEISDEDEDSLTCIIANVSGDFTPDYTFDLDVERVDAPQPIHPLKAWVYLRKE